MSSQRRAARPYEKQLRLKKTLPEEVAYGYSKFEIERNFMPELPPEERAELAYYTQVLVSKIKILTCSWCYHQALPRYSCPGLIGR